MTTPATNQQETTQSPSCGEQGSTHCRTPGVVSQLQCTDVREFSCSGAVPTLLYNYLPLMPSGVTACLASFFTSVDVHFS
jgi:hypothetical protein